MAKSQRMVKTEVPGFLGQIKLTYKVKKNLQVRQATPYRKGLATDRTNRRLKKETLDRYPYPGGDPGSEPQFGQSSGYASYHHHHKANPPFCTPTSSLSKTAVCEMNNNQLSDASAEAGRFQHPVPIVYCPIYHRHVCSYTQDLYPSCNGATSASSSFPQVQSQLI
ncbi:hypothetical protein ATANTOWER_026556 [Ataeniobius toweri]|uniref:Uncharacterized protein n=1 Tax=Ataeniobius toweri TaxID=208326 RepID=A0ABU7BVT6_9TELE|nr:hypothetical protein [Ataeniobius toweri]